MATALQRPAQRQSTWFQKLETSLLAGTSRNPARKSPFDFGVVTAQQFAPKTKFVPASHIGQDIGFTIAECRERIRDFLDGSYSPKRLGDLIENFKTRMLRLESRRGRDGSTANYIVDMRTNKSLPAAAVDARLSRPAIALRFGKSIEAEAEATRRKIARTPETIMAEALRAKLRVRLMAADKDTQLFQDWDDLAFSSPSEFEGRDFTAYGNEIWVGFPYRGSDDPKGNQQPIRASGDPAENLRIMADARAKGIKIIVPFATVEDARKGRLTAGMPILLQEGALKPRLIDPSLSYQRLSNLFGKTPHEHYGEMRDRHAAKLGEQAEQSSKVVDLQRFRREFSRKPAAVAAAAVANQAVATTSRPPVGASNFTVRHERSVDGRETMFIVDQDTQKPYPFDVSVLGAGRFPKEDTFGVPLGYIVVDSDGGYAHYDAAGHEYNPFGPAIVPAPGSGEQPRSATEGQPRQRSGFDGERNREFIQNYSRRDHVEDEVEEDRSTFGMR